MCNEGAASKNNNTHGNETIVNNDVNDNNDKDDDRLQVATPFTGWVVLNVPANEIPMNLHMKSTKSKDKSMTNLEGHKRIHEL